MESMSIKTTIYLFTFIYSLIALSQGVNESPKKYNYLINQDSSENQLILKGRVLDRDHQGIPFVNLGIRNTLHGTAADGEGYFTLKLPQSLINETITISCVGFKSIAIPVAEFKKKYQFVLDDDISQLLEIVIKSERITARDVMKEVIRRIPENYLQGPYTQKKWYRKKGKYKDTQDYYVLEKIEEQYTKKKKEKTRKAAVAEEEEKVTTADKEGDDVEDWVWKKDKKDKKKKTEKNVAEKNRKEKVAAMNAKMNERKEKEIQAQKDKENALKEKLAKKAQEKKQKAKQQQSDTDSEEDQADDQSAGDDEQ